MRAEMAYETCVDVSTCNGLGSFLRHVSRRHEASRLPSPIAMVFAGTSGAVIQFATDDHLSVWAWTTAFGLPIPRLRGSVSPSGITVASPFRIYSSKGVSARIGIEVWCMSTEKKPDVPVAVAAFGPGRSAALRWASC